MQGKLDGLNIVQVLNVLNLAKKSGTLQIFGDDNTQNQEAEIYFEEGQVLVASIQQNRRDLLENLRHARKISERDAVTLREKYDGQTDKGIALHLVSGNYVTRDEITEALQQNTLELMQEIVNWDRREYHFDDTLPDFSETVIAPVDIDRIIKNAAQFTRLQSRLVELIPNLNVALDFPKDAPQNLREVTLTRDEWAVIGYAKPHNSLADIAEACNLTPIAIRRIVARLTDLGVLQIVAQDFSSDGIEAEPLNKVGTGVMRLLNPNHRRKKD